MIRSFTTLSRLNFEALTKTELGEGYVLVKKFLDSRSIDPLTDLAVDYARIFLGAGIVEKRADFSPLRIGVYQR